MSEKKRGRPKKEKKDTIWAWDSQYYKPSMKEDEKARYQVKKERLQKGYMSLWVLAYGEPRCTQDLGKINRAVAGIINEI
jgi:hypothetical protein